MVKIDLDQTLALSNCIKMYIIFVIMTVTCLFYDLKETESSIRFSWVVVRENSERPFFKCFCSF